MTILFARLVLALLGLIANVVILTPFFIIRPVYGFAVAVVLYPANERWFSFIEKRRL